MTLLSVKTLEREIQNRTLKPKDYIVYCLISMGPMFSLIATTRYQVIPGAYSIAGYLKYLILAITVIRYYALYRLIKDKDLMTMAYTIIPLTAVLEIRYVLLLALPLVMFSIGIIKTFQLDFAYWNVINSAAISVLYSIVFTIGFIRAMQKAVEW